MKCLLSIFLIMLVAASSFAEFDTKAWLQKRRQMSVEALRLQSVYTNCLARLETPAEDVAISLETFPDGTVKTSVSAKRAQFFLDTEHIWAEGVVLKKFKKDGTLDARLDAENCAIDRATRSGWADGATKIVQGATVFKGRRVYFSSLDGYVKVFEATDMESSDLKTGGLRP